MCTGLEEEARPLVEDGEEVADAVEVDIAAGEEPRGFFFPKDLKDARKEEGVKKSGSRFECDAANGAGHCLRGLFVGPARLEVKGAPGRGLPRGS